MRGITCTRVETVIVQGDIRASDYYAGEKDATLWVDIDAESTEEISPDVAYLHVHMGHRTVLSQKVKNYILYVLHKHGQVALYYVTPVLIEKSKCIGVLTQYHLTRDLDKDVNASYVRVTDLVVTFGFITREVASEE